MKNERDNDRRQADLFFKSIEQQVSSEDMSIENKVEVLRGVTCFLIQTIQNLYLHVARHSIAHDSFLNGDLGDVFSKTEEMLNLFFDDFMNAKEGEGQDESPSDSEV